MTVAKPTGAEMREVLKRAKASSADDPQLFDNYLFHELFHVERGVYRRKHRVEWDGNGKRRQRSLSRREWIERYFTIKPKADALEVMELAKYPAQRRLEAMVLRQERLGLPVRITQLKARQQGITTGVQADAFEYVMRSENRRALIIAHVDELSRKILRMAHLARDRMDKGDGSKFKFKMASRATDSLVWDEPIAGSITVTSAEKRGAGRGDTVDFLHKTEFAFWREDKTGNVGVDESLPDLPGTFGFTESTANGDSGAFHDLFYSSWEERHRPLLERSQPSVAMFFGWWEHPDYCWSKTFGGGRELPRVREKEILATLDDEEKWLLQQRYLKRWTRTDEWEQYVHRETGNMVWRRKDVGWQSVSLDQLAWRRQQVEKFRSRGGLNVFNQDFPSRPQVAFMSTGDRVFDPQVIVSYMNKATQPILRGDLAIAGEVPDLPPLSMDEIG